MKKPGLAYSLIATVTILLVLFASGGTAFAAHQPEPEQAVQAQAANLKIALLAPMSGQVSFFGASARQGAEMAVAEWNQKGGVLGRTIQLAVEDSQCQAAAASAAAIKVISQDGVDYIVGEICSSASVAIAQIAEANGVVQISPSSTNPSVTLNNDSSVKQYVFRACFIDPFQGAMMARFAMQQKYFKTFILHDESNYYSKDLAAAFRTAYDEVQGSIVGDETYTIPDPNTHPNYGLLFNRIKTSQADAVYMPDFASDFLNNFITGARAAGVNAVFLGGDGWLVQQTLPSALNGSFYTDHFSIDDPRPVVQTYNQKYNQLYGADSDPIAALSYDSTNLMLSAIQSAGVDDPAMVKDRLAQMTLHGVTGIITFDENHNPYKSVVIKQIQNGHDTYYTTFDGFGSISGHVYTADGSPITDTQILVQAIGVSRGTKTVEELALQSDGSYTLSDLIPGTYKILANSGRSPGYVAKYYNNRLNLDLADPVSVGASDTLAGIDFYLEAPVTTVVDPQQQQPATLEYAPPQGPSTEIEVPQNSVSTETVLTYSPASADHIPGFMFEDTAFNLEAYQQGVLQNHFVFNTPILVTLHYSDTISTLFKEEELTLRYWNDASKTWEDALCPGYTYTRNLVDHILTVPVCHLSAFALFVDGYVQYFPVASK